MMLRKEFVQKIGFDEQLKYLSDYDLVVHLARTHLFWFFEEPLAKYRIHGKNTICADTEGWVRDNLILKRRFCKTLSYRRNPGAY
jgi:hypothetical protein